VSVTQEKWMPLNRVTRSFGLSLCALGLNVNVAYAGEPATDLVRFERIHEISVEDFWDLAPSVVIFSKVNAVTVYWPFDYDSISEADGWRLIGIVGAGLSDLGVTPVVAKVYARRDVYLLEEESRSLTAQSGDASSAIFGISPKVCRDEPREDCTQRVTFSINESYVVTGGSVELGVVEE
jgi:hypothetical protein